MADSYLSPHGDGYCTECRFIVGLTAEGVLEEHARGHHNRYEAPRPCKGSGRLPRRTPAPKDSRKSAFRVIPRTAGCPGCGQTVPVTPEHWYGRHYLPKAPLRAAVQCAWSLRAVQQ